MNMRFASINIYVLNDQLQEDLDRIKGLNLDSIGFQEAHNRLDVIKNNLTDFNHYRDPDSNHDGAKEVTISLNKRTEYLGHNGIQVSFVSDANETRYFKDRWITVVRFVCDGVRYAHINYHGNAAVQNSKGELMHDEPRVKEWVNAARIIDDRIKYWKERDFRVIVTGDFNYRRYDNADFELAYWSPQRMFQRNRMDWEEHGLDYIAWPDTVMQLKSNTIYPRTTGSDHAWLVVELV